MTSIDNLIHKALDPADRALFEETQELGYFQLGLSQFSGKLGWVTWVIMATQVALFAAGAYCSVQFFGAVDVLAAVKWGMSGAVLLLMAINFKLSLMPQMQADRVIREIKRVELMLANRKQR